MHPRSLVVTLSGWGAGSEAGIVLETDVILDGAQGARDEEDAGVGSDRTPGREQFL